MAARCIPDELGYLLHILLQPLPARCSFDTGDKPVVALAKGARAVIPARSRGSGPIMEIKEILNLLFPFILSMVGAITGIYALWRQSKRDKPDIAEKYQAIAQKALDETEELHARLDKLDKELRDRDKYIDALLRGITRLMDQIKRAGSEPDWYPPEKRPYEE